MYFSNGVLFAKRPGLPERNRFSKRQPETSERSKVPESILLNQSMPRFTGERDNSRRNRNACMSSAFLLGFSNYRFQPADEKGGTERERRRKGVCHLTPKPVTLSPPAPSLLANCTFHFSGFWVIFSSLAEESFIHVFCIQTVHTHGGQRPH